MIKYFDLDKELRTFLYSKFQTGYPEGNGDEVKKRMEYLLLEAEKMLHAYQSIRMGLPPGFDMSIGNGDEAHGGGGNRPELFLTVPSGTGESFHYQIDLPFPAF